MSGGPLITGVRVRTNPDKKHLDELFRFILVKGEAVTCQSIRNGNTNLTGLT